MKPDARVLTALCRLQEPGFEPLLEYWRTQRQETLEQMTNAMNPDVLRQMQGRARAMGDLLKDISEARTILHKIEGKP